LLYKEDWQEVQKRLDAWWSGEIIDRVVIQVTAQRKGVTRTSNWDVWTLMQNRDNPEIAIAEFEKFCQEIYFGGEAFPNFWINFGPGSMAAYIGAIPRFEKDTVWLETPTEWSKLQEVKFDHENIWWKMTKKCTVLSSEAGKGKWITGNTDLGGPTDIAASLRGTQNLLFDLLENGEKVKQLTGQITKLWYEYYQELYGITKKNGMPGTSAWMGIWSPKRWYPVQCDFSAMISPEMFAEFVAPYLQEQCQYLDHTIYHWDGPGEIPHLDLLLDIPELNGIQWTPGSGQPGVESPKWFPLYKRIQQKGKLLVLLGVPPDKIEGLLNEISPEGVLIGTSVSSEDEAKELLKKAEKRSFYGDT